VSAAAARLARWLLAATALLALCADGGVTTRAAAPGEAMETPAAPRATSGPTFDATGALRRPEGYREWVLAGATLGLSYEEGGKATGRQEFHHVYLRPESYDAYVRTGRFPDGTMLVLEHFEATEQVAPARRGLSEGRRTGLSAAVKDARLSDGWGYFSFEDGSRPTARPRPRETCFECHRQHAAVDNVFVQFYPVLRDARH
jgi:cytochrome P460